MSPVSLLLNVLWIVLVGAWMAAAAAIAGHFVDIREWR